jgi:mono/diheme cytochrome c family protein
MTPSPEMLARGQMLYSTTCASCHGTKGEGNGPAGAGLKPPPRNFTRAEAWVNGNRIEDVFKTLEQGIKGSSMVSYGYLPKRDRMALVHYVRSLGSFTHAPEDPKALNQIAELFAHSGEVIPNRIPVALAMTKLEREFAPPGSLPAAADPVLGPAILDPIRAAQTLAGVPGWAGSAEALAQGIATGAPENGFAPAVALYSGDQWRDLLSALKRTVEEKAR